MGYCFVKRCAGGSSGPKIETEETSVTITENTETVLEAAEGKAFSKVTITTAVESSGGGEQPQLFTPTISMSGFTISVADEKNGAFSRNYKFYAEDGSLVATVAAKEVDISQYIDTSKGFKVYAIVTADKFTDSASSNIISFVVVEGTQGLEYWSWGTGAAVTAIGSATDKDIIIPSAYEGVPVVRIGNAAFKYAGITSVKFPDTVTQIWSEAFYGCRQLTTVEGFCATTLQERAFASCSVLTSITFKTTATSIDTSAFSACSQLKDIYVPWAEGAVSGAPWGATNATIHYNSEV